MLVSSGSSFSVIDSDFLVLVETSGLFSDAIRPVFWLGTRNPADISEIVFESGVGALAKNNASVNRMVDFMSVHSLVFS